MKVNIESFLLSEKLDLKKNIFFIGGNEETLISHISETIINFFVNDGFEKIYKKEKSPINDESGHDSVLSLFNKNQIIIYKNPGDIDFSFLEKQDLKDSVFVIVQEKKINPKNKKFFDSHKAYFSFGCYKIDDGFKKRIINYFISQNNISLDRDAYWFFVENSGDEYKLLEGDLIKIKDVDKKEISIGDVRGLLAQKNNYDFDGLFFALTLSRPNLLQKSSSAINSKQDAFIFINRVMFFINILAVSESIEDVEKNFPKYLFRKKENFRNIYKKTTTSKIMDIFSLIKKTELLIRKNDKNFLAIVQRFLLNLQKKLG